MRGGKMQTIKSKIDDNDYTISYIFEKYGKTSKPSFSSSIRKNDNLIDNYIDIYDRKEKYSYPEQDSDNEEDLLSRTSTIRSSSLSKEDLLSRTSTIRSSSKRALKNYKEIDI